MFKRISFFIQEKKTDIDTKYDDNEFMLLFLQKNSVLFYERKGSKLMKSGGNY